MILPCLEVSSHIVCERDVFVVSTCQLLIMRCGSFISNQIRAFRGSNAEHAYRLSIDCSLASRHRPGARCRWLLWSHSQRLSCVEIWPEARCGRFPRSISRRYLPSIFCAKSDRFNYWRSSLWVSMPRLRPISLLIVFQAFLGQSSPLAQHPMRRKLYPLPSVHT